MNEEQQKRFWAKVDRRGPDECWEWQASRYGSGYGGYRIDGQTRLAHRVSYELANGPIEDGRDVCHSCDNRLCVNPAHLWMGTAKENLDDCRKKGRQAEGERNGLAKLTDEQVSEVRLRYAAGDITQKELAAEFGLCQGSVSFIVRGLLRKGAEGPHSDWKPKPRRRRILAT